MIHVTTATLADDTTLLAVVIPPQIHFTDRLIRSVEERLKNKIERFQNNSYESICFYRIELRGCTKLTNTKKVLKCSRIKYSAVYLQSEYSIPVDYSNCYRRDQ